MNIISATIPENQEEQAAKAARFGTAAFRRGAPCLPAQDADFMKMLHAGLTGDRTSQILSVVDLIGAWLDAWTKEKLASTPASSDVSVNVYAHGVVAQAMDPFGFEVVDNGAGPVLERVEADETCTIIVGAERDGGGALTLTEPIHVCRDGAMGPERFVNLQAYMESQKAEILAWMAAHRKQHEDRKTGELNTTSLVEAWDEACSTGEATIDTEHIAWELAATLVKL